MSFHIVHISEHGCRLSKDRGFLICAKDNSDERKLAIEDIRALVLISESVAYSSAIVAALLDNDAMILHCHNYKPTGITLPLCRTYDASVTLNQRASSKVLNRDIWNRLLRAKVANSACALDEMGADAIFLKGALSFGGQIDEARCAKEYWKKYFPAIGAYGEKRNPEDASSKPNAMLNYGYGVVGGLVHRAIIVHGLSPLFGVFHKTYYKNTPLVYDVIEPFRAIVDLLLYKYLLLEHVPDIRGWSKYLGRMLRDFRVNKGSGSLKLMDAIDACAASLANCYRRKNADMLWVPYLDKKYAKKSREKKSVQNGLADGNV